MEQHKVNMAIMTINDDDDDDDNMMQTRVWFEFFGGLF